jgi:thiamine monophosphate synthase
MTKDGWIIPMRGYNLGGAENVIEFSSPSIAVIRAFMREAGAKESEEGKRE